MRELLVVAGGRGLQILIGLATLRVITWQLETAELGQYSLILTLTTLFALALINPLGMYFYRHVHEWVEQGRGPVLLVLLLLGCSLMAVLTGAIIALAYLLDFTVSLAWMLLLISGSLLLVSTNNTLVSAFNILGYRLSWVFYSVLTLGGSLALSYSLMQIETSAEMWLLGQLLGHGLMLVPVIAVFYRRVRSEPSVEPVNADIKQFVRDQSGGFIRFCWPLSIAVTLNWGQFQSSRVFLGEFGSLEMLGYFTAAYAVCAGVMSSIESIAQQYYYPKLYKDISQASPAQCIASWQRYAQIMVPVVLLFFMFVLCFAEPLLVVLVDEKYHGALTFVYVAAFMELFRMLGNIYSICMQATKDTSRMVLPQLLGCIAAMTLIPALIWFAGSDGFAIAVVCSSGLYAWLIRRTVIGYSGPLPAGVGLPVLGSIALGYVLIYGALGQLELGLMTSLVALFFGGITTLGGLYAVIHQLKEAGAYVS